MALESKPQDGTSTAESISRITDMNTLKIIQGLARSETEEIISHHFQILRELLPILEASGLNLQTLTTGISAEVSEFNLSEVLKWARDERQNLASKVAEILSPQSQYHQYFIDGLCELLGLSEAESKEFRDYLNSHSIERSVMLAKAYSQNVETWHQCLDDKIIQDFIQNLSTQNESVEGRFDPLIKMLIVLLMNLLKEKYQLTKLLTEPDLEGETAESFDDGEIESDTPDVWYELSSTDREKETLLFTLSRATVILDDLVNDLEPLTPKQAESKWADGWLKLDCVSIYLEVVKVSNQLEAWLTLHQEESASWTGRKHSTLFGETVGIYHTVELTNYVKTFFYLMHGYSETPSTVLFGDDTEVKDFAYLTWSLNTQKDITEIYELMLNRIENLLRMLDTLKPEQMETAQQWEEWYPGFKGQLEVLKKRIEIVVLGEDEFAKVIKRLENPEEGDQGAGVEGDLIANRVEN